MKKAPQIASMAVVQREVSSLVPYENNARKHPKEQVAKLADSIRDF